MENGYGLCHVWKPMKNEEFQEEDIWEDVHESDKTPVSFQIKDPFFTISNSAQTAPKTRTIIPKSNKNPNIITQEVRKQPENFIHRSSAPANIPDWSKIYGTASKNKRNDDDNNNGSGYSRSSWESHDEEDEDEEGNLIPPHELIAKQRPRKQIFSFSVCEGAGRTLKGRDLSRVRNAVLTRTGFLESNYKYYH